MFTWQLSASAHGLTSRLCAFRSRRLPFVHSTATNDFSPSCTFYFQNDYMHYLKHCVPVFLGGKWVCNKWSEVALGTIIATLNDRHCYLLVD